MWCDNFDMDLPRVIPEAMAAIESVRDVILYTHGHAEDGLLNHPSVWNSGRGPVAFFGFEPTTIKSKSFYTDSPVVRCTFEEAVRDCWPHNYILAVNHFAAGEWRSTSIWDSSRLYDQFMQLMYHVRGWRRSSEEEIGRARQDVIDSLILATQRMQIVLSGLPSQIARSAKIESGR